MNDLVHDCFKPGRVTLNQVLRPDKPDVTKHGLTRNQAKPNLGKPVNIFHKCNPVKPGPRINPWAPWYITYIYISMCRHNTRIKRALRARNGLRNYITDIYIYIHICITADILQQIYYGRYSTADILQQIYYCRYSTADVLRQIYYSRYIIADILRQIYYGRYITEDVLRHTHICIYYRRYIMADILRQIYYGTYITADILRQI